MVVDGLPKQFRTGKLKHTCLDSSWMIQALVRKRMGSRLGPITAQQHFLEMLRNNFKTLDIGPFSVTRTRLYQFNIHFFCCVSFVLIKIPRGTRSGKWASILANNALIDTWYSNESFVIHLHTAVSISCNNSAVKVLLNWLDYCLLHSSQNLIRRRENTAFMTWLSNAFSFLLRKPFV